MTKNPVRMSQEAYDEVIAGLEVLKDKPYYNDYINYVATRFMVRKAYHHRVYPLGWRKI